MTNGKRIVRGLVWGSAFLLFLALIVNPVSRPQAKSQDTYEKLKIFSDVLTYVETSYVDQIDSQKLIYGAIRGMLRELDPHSSFMSPDMFKEMQVDTKGEFGGLGITIGMRNDVLTVIAPIEDTPAWKIGVKAGDQILKVNDEPTRDMTVEDAVKRMRGTPGTSVDITIMRTGFDEPKKFTIVRDIIKLKSVKFKMIDDTVGVIRLTSFQERTSQDLRAAIQELKASGQMVGLVLDLRNNPGGLLDQSVKVASEFLAPNLVVVSTRGRKQSQNSELKSSGGDLIPGLPMIILLNQGSASASEIVAGALQDHGRALVMGTTSFGKGSVQTVIPLEDGAGLRLTTAKYYTPKGRSIQNTGIEPDLVVSQASVTPITPPKAMHVKEADLPGHLDNEQTNKDNAPGADEGPKELGDISTKDDFQLQQAAGMIKSWKLFQKINPTLTTASP